MLSGGTVAFERGPETSCILPSENAIRLGLAVNELITNAAKHSDDQTGPGHVRICCLRQGEQVLLRISNDGPGLPPDFDPAESSRFGLRMVGMMAQQTGCELEFRNTPGGSMVELRIPAAPEASEPASAVIGPAEQGVSA